MANAWVTRSVPSREPTRAPPRPLLAGTEGGKAPRDLKQPARPPRPGELQQNRTELAINFREEYLGEIRIQLNPPPRVIGEVERLVDELRHHSEPLAGDRPPGDECKHALEQAKAALDTAVYALYGLTRDQVREVESSVPYSD